MDGAPSFERAGRDQAFGYECRRCLRCCHHKRIQLNPYEVARLARNRGLSTTEFRAAHTADGAGAYLAQTPDGACVFLGTDGCTVHPDRPLVCRLYPLGRYVDFEGKESFGLGQIAPHPQSEGVYHMRGQVADYLAAQGAEPYMAAADDYLAWLTAAVNALSAETGLSGDALLQSTSGDASLLDLDAVIAEHCAATGEPEPDDIEARKRLHLSILYARLPTTKGDPDGK